MTRPVNSAWRLPMYEIEQRQLTEQPTLVVRDKVAAEDVGPWLEAAFSEVARYMNARVIQMAGPPFVRYLLMQGVFEIEAGFPTMMPAPVEGRLELSQLPGGSVAMTMHTGPYEALPAAFQVLTEWIAKHGYEQAGPHWEVYFTDPKEEPDQSKWQTQVFMPFTKKAEIT